jgi:hypothetical protein
MFPTLSDIAWPSLYGAWNFPRVLFEQRDDRTLSVSVNFAPREDIMAESTTACGGIILILPKAQEHLRAHPEVEALLPEAIGRVILPRDGSFLSTEVEMGRIVGLSGRVRTPPIGPSDRSLFAQRIRRERPSRVVMGEGEETTKVVILAFPAKESADTYVLATSWVGSLAPKEPWDPMITSQEERQECLQFWYSHALIYDPSVMTEPFESTWEEVLK